MGRGPTARVALSLLVLAASCGGSRTPAVASPSEVSPPFSEILLVAKFAEYKVHFKAGGDGSEQSWYFKQGKARFDVKAIVGDRTALTSVFLLPDGIFRCTGVGLQAQCSAMADVESALQQDPIALYQESLFAHPSSFNGAIAEQRHISVLHGHCYDVRPVGAPSEPTAFFCYTLGGMALQARVTARAVDRSLEAASLTFIVPDTDFKLPAKPAILGQP